MNEQGSTDSKGKDADFFDKGFPTGNSAGKKKPMK
jgi:hypothetical protein